MREEPGATKLSEKQVKLFQTWLMPQYEAWAASGDPEEALDELEASLWDTIRKPGGLLERITSEETERRNKALALRLKPCFVKMEGLLRELQQENFELVQKCLGLWRFSVPSVTESNLPVVVSPTGHERILLGVEPPAAATGSKVDTKAPGTVPDEAFDQAEGDSIGIEVRPPDATEPVAREGDGEVWAPLPASLPVVELGELGGEASVSVEQQGKSEEDADAAGRAPAAGLVPRRGE